MISTQPGPEADTSVSVPDLLYSDVEREVRSSVRKLLDAEATWQAVLALSETDAPVDLKLWDRLRTDLGVATLPIAEAHGGAGASWRETAVVMEELGRATAPVPFLGSSVLATAFAEAADTDAVLGHLGGGRTVALAVPAGTAADTAHICGHLDGDRLSAEVTRVVDASAADLLIVPVDDGRVVLVETQDPAITTTARTSLDMTRQLSDVLVDCAHGEVIAEGDAAARGLRAAAMIGSAMLASEQLGLAEWCLDTSVAYLKDRRQFGRALGSYQALKHRCADLWVQVTQARAVARYAASCAATGSDDLAIAAFLAQALCSTVAVRAAEECVQLHGGIGFTWEFPAHLHLKRAKADSLLLGNAGYYRARLAELVDLPSGTDLT